MGLEENAMNAADARNFQKAAQGRVSFVEVPRFEFLMIDGKGDPDGQPFQEAVAALYAVAYKLKFALKQAEGVEYKVGTLEGLWWIEGMGRLSFSELNQRRAEWEWTLLVAQPEAVTQDWFEKTREEVEQKKGLPALDRLWLEHFHEGLSAQILHVGPYAAEEPTLALLYEAIQQRGYRMSGKHHEIYLGDPQRAPQEKLKTPIRHPVM